MTDVRVGQVWADKDPRSAGRTLVVERIEEDKRKGQVAVCKILTNAHDVQEYVDGVCDRPSYAKNAYQDRRGRTVLIRTDRFVETSSGYMLVLNPKDGKENLGD